MQQLTTSLLINAKELTKFRRLAQLVIRQRGEVELFLLDSIQVRAQFLTEVMTDHATGHIYVGKFFFSFSFNTG